MTVHGAAVVPAADVSTAFAAPSAVDTATTVGVDTSWMEISNICSVSLPSASVATTLTSKLLSAVVAENAGASAKASPALFKNFSVSLSKSKSAPSPYVLSTVNVTLD